MCDIDQQSHTLYILTSLSKQIPTFWMQWSQTLVLHHNHFSQLHVLLLQNSKEHLQGKEHNVCTCDCQDQIQDNHQEFKDSWDEDVTTLEDKGIG